MGFDLPLELIASTRRLTATSATSSASSHTATCQPGSSATLASRRVPRSRHAGGQRSRPTEQQPEGQRVFHLGLAGVRPFRQRNELIPTFEMFNTFSNKNNINPLVTPALFNFDGFLRLGVGDPRQVQLSVDSCSNVRPDPDVIGDGYICLHRTDRQRCGQ
jgi:hypothetical protein